MGSCRPCPCPCRLHPRCGSLPRPRRIAARRHQRRTVLQRGMTVAATDLSAPSVRPCCCCRRRRSALDSPSRRRARGSGSATGTCVCDRSIENRDRVEFRMRLRRSGYEFGFVFCRPWWLERARCDVALYPVYSRSETVSQMCCETPRRFGPSLPCPRFRSGTRNNRRSLTSTSTTSIPTLQQEKK